jgi:hypothetical protein
LRLQPADPLSKRCGTSCGSSARTAGRTTKFNTPPTHPGAVGPTRLHGTVWSRVPARPPLTRRPWPDLRTHGRRSPARRGTGWGGWQVGRRPGDRAPAAIVTGASLRCPLTIMARPAGARRAPVGRAFFCCLRT